MQIQVGIPRALLYHEFGELWTKFFHAIEVPVTVSDETNKRMLDRGTSLAIDESCLPLKVYLGHVDSLLDTCSHIFVPRIAQYHHKFHLCPKFAGLPDIVKNTFRLPAEQLIAPNIETKSLITQIQAIYTTCRAVGVSPFAGYIAYQRTIKSWKDRNLGIQSPKPQVALIGHNYLIKDEFFCGEIVHFLTSQGVSVITPDHIANKVLYNEAKAFEPDIYWQLSARIAGATRYFCRQPDIAGVVMVSGFGCGPDSLINEYLVHHVFEESNKPYIILNIDEHTGIAGVITRIEAFLDLVNRGLRT